MSRFFARFDKTYYLLVPVVLHLTLPWLKYRVRPIVPFLLFCLWFVLQKNANRMFFQKRRFTQLCTITLVFFVLHSCLRNIFALFGHGEFFTYSELSTFLSAIIHFIIVYLSFKYMKFKEMEFLTIVALIGISLAGIAAVRGGIIEGFEGGRMMTTAVDLAEAAGKFDDKVLAYQIGSANYATTYAFAIFPASLLWASFKVKKLSIRVLLIVALFSCVWTVKNSGLGTPVFVLLLGIMLFLFTKVGFKGWSMRVFGTMAAVLLITFSYNPKIFSPLGSAIQTLGRAFPEESSIQHRCESVAEAFSGDQTTYAFNRYQLQRRSMDAFLEHPIFGTGIYTAPNPKAFAVGGHSHLLDRLGQAGIIGGFFYFGFLMFLYLYYKQMTASFGFPRQWLLVMLIVIFVYIFTCISNPLPTFPEVLYYIPGLVLLTLKYSEGNRNMGFGNMGHAQGY